VSAALKQYAPIVFGKSWAMNNKLNDYYAAYNKVWG